MSSTSRWLDDNAQRFRSTTSRMGSKGGQAQHVSMLKGAQAVVFLDESVAECFMGVYGDALPSSRSALFPTVLMVQSKIQPLPLATGVSSPTPAPFFL